jgi:hypothetical protein
MISKLNNEKIMNKKNDKKRLFEVMTRLDKTFKSKLNESVEMDAEVSPEEPVAALPSGEESTEEKTPEEKLEELTAKVDELYALLHGEEVATDNEKTEALQEKKQWNFEKGKGAKKFEKKEDKESEEHEESETPAEEEKEHKEKKELGEVKDNAGKKVPVAAVAKVGK